MEGRTIENSPQLFARVGGGLYLVIIVAGGFAEGFVRNTLIVSGDAGATARNIAASSGLWQVAVAGELVMVLCALALALVEYGLLRPVSRYLASLALATNLVSIAIETVDRILVLLASSIVNAGASLGAFTAEQRDALAYLALKAHGITFHVSLLLFGAVCLLLGYLISRAGYLPRALGRLLQLGGACYVVASGAAIFLPGLEARLFPFILIPPFVGELSLCLWLLLKGVDLPKWRQRLGARAAQTSV